MKNALRSTSWFAVTALAAVLSMAGCGGSDGETARDASISIDPTLAKGTNDFGFNLYRKLAEKDGGKNQFVSPASISLALSMTLNGAKGATQDSMKTTLGVGSLTLDEMNRANKQLLTLLANPDPKVELLVANALWTQKELTPDPGFISRDTEFYEAAVQSVQFTDPVTADTINRWASDKTRGTIDTIVTAPDIHDDIIELTNAVYFKGPWTDPFDPSETNDGQFTKADGTVKTVPMMKRFGLIDYQQTDLFEAVRLPYGGKYLAMYIFLPKQGKTLADVAGAATAQTWSQWAAGFQPQEMNILLPRFKADYSVGLKDALSALGMSQAFDASSADFGGIFAPNTVLPGSVFLTHVFHKTYLSVDEKGTTAAAVTDVGGGAASAPPSMVVNRPFFLAIADAPTGVILFLGSISDPQ